METANPPAAVMEAIAFLESEETTLSLERLTALYLNATGALSFGLWPDRSPVVPGDRAAARLMAQAAAAKALALHQVTLAQATGVPIPDRE